MLVEIVLLLALLGFFLLWFFYGRNRSDPEEEEVCPAEEARPPPVPSFDLAAEAAEAKREGRSLGERLTCRALESIYRRPFPKVRILRNPETGRLMEIDCYNSDLRIGAEYNGEQHYRWPNWTGQTYSSFLAQVRRDDLKIRLSRRLGIYLLTVPYTVPPEDIPSFLCSSLPNGGAGHCPPQEG